MCTYSLTATPRIGLGIVPRSILVTIIAEEVRPATPDQHLATCPDGCMKPAPGWGIVHGGWLPNISRRNVSAAAIEKCAVDTATPDDHLPPGPHCRMSGARARRRRAR